MGVWSPGPGATAGNDTYTGDATAETVDGLDGDDTLDGRGGSDTLSGGDGHDVLRAGSSDFGLSGAGADVLNGGAGDDDLLQLSAGDTANGGDGIDLAEVLLSGTLNAGGTTVHNYLGLDVDLTDAIAGTLILSVGGVANAVSLSGIEIYEITFGAGNDRAFGGAYDDWLEGDSYNFPGGNDELHGRGGNDYLYGGAGSDVLFGDEGNDELRGGEVSPGRDDFAVDELYGGAGDDILRIHAGDLGDGGDGADDVELWLLGSNFNYTFDLSSIPQTGPALELGNGVRLLAVETVSRIWLGGGADHVISGDWEDYISGEGGDDWLEGAGGDDYVTGDSGADTLFGGAGEDLLNGGSGNDILDGGTGADGMLGGAGDDIFIVDDGDDTVSESSNNGIDLVRSSVNFSYTLGNNVENLELAGVAAIDGNGNALDNVITGNSAANTLNGGDGNDTLIGNEGNDTLLGGAGADIINGGIGADAMVGNSGDDTFYVDHLGDTVAEGSIVGGVDTVYTRVTFSLAPGGYTDHLILEEAGGAINGSGNALDNTITGNSLANTLQGSAGNDTLNAGGGNDTLLGGDGNDILNGEAGADTMTGNFGDDTYYVDSASDIVQEGNIAGGSDLVYSSVTFNLGPTGYADGLTLTGAVNIDGFGNILSNTILGNSGVNALWGNGGNDTLNGGDGNDALYGGDGGDILFGGAGADGMTGNFGDDIYYVDDLGDVVSEGNAAGGVDTVFTSVNFHLGATGFAENLTLSGSANINGSGNSLNNTIYGNAGVNTLTGNAGNDTILGAEGADTLIGGDGHDFLDGGIGADAMIGNSGDDVYYVDNAGDTVSEGSSVGGNDIVNASVSFSLAPTGFVENLTLTGDNAINGVGNGLANTIIGNGAANTLTGAAGADSFVFSTALGPNNIDTITDYSVVDDTIVLSASVFINLAPGALAAGEFVIGASAVDADDHIIYNSATGALYYDADGAGGVAAIQFATLTAGLALTNNDFIVGGG